MPTYSHSQLETFLQCKLKFKFKYIDKIKVPVPKTIELFMGDVVHQALKFLYDGVVKGTIFPQDFVLKNFDDTWKQLWKDEILIVRDRTQEDYKKMGRSFLSQFYELYFPFDEIEIIGLETNDRYVLVDGNSYYVRIDKLGRDAEGTYYVCDYKTNNKLKSDEELYNDRQLAMYSLWVKQKYPDAKAVKLVWYFLAHNKKIEVSHTQESLSEIEQRTLDIIKQIQTATAYPANPGRLCDWCEYKSICPAWNPSIVNKAATHVRVAASLESAGSRTFAVVEEKKNTKQQTLDFF